MYEKLVELLEPYMSGEPCDAESGSCELTNCRTCDAIALANRLIFHDVVPVVRCKDCKHYKPPKVSAHYVNHTQYCTRVVTMKVSPDSFCSYGERKDGENVDGGLAGRPETV